MPASSNSTQPLITGAVPEIKAIQVNSVTHSSATISWTTSQPCDGFVQWGTGSDYGFVAQPAGPPEAQRSVTLKGLGADTTYHYGIVATGPNGGLAVSPDATFKTLQQLSSTPADILYIGVGGITGSAASIEWETDKPTSGRVEYGVTGLYGYSSAMGSPFTYTHSLDLSQLSPGTIYHFRVIVQDREGNELTSEDQLFATAEPSDRMAPAITGIKVTGITYEGATIEWVTDELATGQVEYGTTLIYGKITPQDGCYLFEHDITLDSLDVDRPCHFRIRSVDSSGNVAVSADNVFVTLTAPRTAGIVPSRHPRCRCRY